MLDPALFIANPKSVAQALLERGVEATRVVRVERLAAAVRRLDVESLERGVEDVVRGMAARAPSNELEEYLRELALLPNLPDPSTPRHVVEVSPLIEANESIHTARCVDPANQSRGHPVLALPGYEQLRGNAATMLRALATYALDIHADAFVEVSGPAVVTTQSLWRSGHLPKFESSMMRLPKDDLWMIPTAETMLCALHSDQHIPEGLLPLRYIARSTCFRGEVGAGGVAARFRLHQYEQVELFTFCEPDSSGAELELLLDRAQTGLKNLDITFRVRALHVGALPFSSTKAYKIEAYLPQSCQWLDISTVSLIGDFQARRALTKSARGRKFVHTLNASAMACSRVRNVLAEYGYDGSSQDHVPTVLRKYFASYRC